MFLAIGALNSIWATLLYTLLYSLLFSSVPILALKLGQLVVSRANAHSLATRDQTAGIVIIPLIFSLALNLESHFNPIDYNPLWQWKGTFTYFGYLLCVFGDPLSGYILALTGYLLYLHLDFKPVPGSSISLIEDHIDSTSTPSNVALTSFNSKAPYYLTALLLLLALPNLLPSFSVPNLTPLKASCILPSLDSPPTVESYLYETTVSAARGNKLSVWPESALTLRNVNAYTQLENEVKSIAIKYKVFILFTYTLPSSIDPFKLQNSLTLIDPTGNPILNYTKRALVPFTESFHFTSGTVPAPLATISLPLPTSHPRHSHPSIRSLEVIRRSLSFPKRGRFLYLKAKSLRATFCQNLL